MTTTIKGKIIPLKDKILVTDMEFGMEVTKSGIIVQSDDGKPQGVKPRWGRVWAIGPDQTEVNVGDWLLIEHGRWTRTWKIEQEDGSITNVHGIDNKAIMLVSDEKPEDVMRGQA
jgi:co-chaperonin GroES (HSP10)